MSELVHAPHVAAIASMSALVDGSAAVTVDELGGVRIWPALDGSREPVVLHDAAPRSAAIARGADGFSIVIVDAAGGGALLSLDGDGRMLDRRSLAGDAPIATVLAAPGGVLVGRGDQTIELVDASGAVRGRVAPDAGRHVQQILVRGARALAVIIDAKGRASGRWLTFGGGLAWGDATPPWPGAVARAVLSPDGGLVAVQRPDLRTAIIDLATGKPRPGAACAGSDDDARPTPVAFWSAHELACASRGTFAWWDLDARRIVTRTPAAGPLGPVPTLAVGDMLLAAADENLALVRPGASHVLGYLASTPDVLVTGPGGVLSGKVDGGFVALDAQLAARASFLEDPERFSRPRTVTLMLDERYAVEASDRHGSRHFEIAVRDLATGLVHQMLPELAERAELQYEPATKLLLAMNGDGPVVRRYDEAAHRFGEPMSLPGALDRRAWLVDPARAHGAAVIAVTHDGTISHVSEIDSADLQPGRPASPRRTFDVRGLVGEVDRAGHLYASVIQGPPGVQVYDRDVAGALLPGIAGWTVRPRLDGERFVAFMAPSIEMFDAAGRELWRTSAWKVRDLVWTWDGRLLARFETGIAPIDPETGAIGAPRCGWLFGLHERVPAFAASDEPSVCDAP